MTDIIFKLDVFEGPFELLFHLIEKNEMDIYDIKIASLTDQYMEYLQSYENRDMDDMSAFLLMAATLLMIKSEMLLPKVKNEDGTEEDPRLKLTEMLLEYKRFKEIAGVLKNKEAETGIMLFKKPDAEFFEIINVQRTPLPGEVLQGVTIEEIRRVFNDVMRRRELRQDKIRGGFGTVNLDRFTVDEKIALLRERLKENGKLFFSRILLETSCREEAVVTFCAVLELIKMNIVTAKQRGNFADIVLCEIPDIKGFI
ncbi:MAG: segregation/condensation protein A [Clostridiales bacterium]|jgi:segregation and condensation protein A|nr:segregation/condensation protein A [Clostridiales bacterium]